MFPDAPLTGGQIIGWAVFGISLIGAVYTLAAGRAVRWFVKRPAQLAKVFPSVSILKPLHGDEPGLRQNLEGFCQQDYPGSVQIVFGVRDPFDPAIGVVKALIQAHPNVSIDLVIDPRTWGANLKISNLINMSTLVRHPFVVMADSDVGVGPDYLRQLMGALADPAVGFATCAYIGAPTGNLWSDLSAMSINHHFFPSVAFGLRLKLAKPCFGPTVAFRWDEFQSIGGFARFADQLADDFEIGRALLQPGKTLAVPPMLIRHGCPERTGWSVFSHELRWARTIRLIDPVSYAGSVVCHPLPWSLAACWLLKGSAAAWVGLALVLVSRLYVVFEVARSTGGDAGLWWLSPLRDLMSAAVHVCGFWGRGVEWRGRRFDIGPGGVLIPRIDRNKPSSVEFVSVLAAIVRSKRA
jgi:ceramide glucosyltransferase